MHQKFTDETEYKSFVERTISALFSDPESEPGLFELVKLYQTTSIQEHAGNKKMNKGFDGRFFSDRTITVKPLDPSLDQEQRNEILDSRKSLLEKVKKYIGEKFNPAKVNAINSEKENYKPPPTIDEMLLKFNISEEDYYHALSISVDDDYELHFI